MEDNERYTYEIIKDIYEGSWSDAKDIIARAQNPLAAISVIIAVLIYLAPKVYEFPKLTLENAAVLGCFYVALLATLLYTGLTCYYLVRGFKLGGYVYKNIGSPDEIISLLEQGTLRNIIDRYKLAAEYNLEINSLRMVYIRKATETIILAVAFSFPCGIMYCIIASILGLNR